MSNLRGALKSVTEFFYKYANHDGNGFSITRKELKVLLQQELKMDIEGYHGKEKLDKIFNDLDKNKDNVVNFEEFCDLFVLLLKISDIWLL